MFIVVIYYYIVTYVSRETLIYSNNAFRVLYLQLPKIMMTRIFMFHVKHKYNDAGVKRYFAPPR